MPQTSKLQRAIESAQRDALIQHIRSSPELTLGEIVQLGGGLGAIAKSIRIGDLHGRGGVKAKSRPAGAVRSVETRTQAGREKYDAKVLAEVKAAGGAIGAEVLRPKVGGAPNQLRASLARLVSEKRVKRSGQARATVYTFNK